MVIVATGRRPYTENVGAKELGIKLNKWNMIEINKTW